MLLLLLLPALAVSSWPPCNMHEIVISEVHTNGQPADYVELFNKGARTCSLEGFELSDEDTFTDDNLVFGALDVIPANSYLLGYQFNKLPGNFSYNFAHESSIMSHKLYFRKSVGSQPTVYRVKPILFSWGESYSSLSQSYDYAYPEHLPCWSSPTPGGPNANCVDLQYPPPPAPTYRPPPRLTVLPSPPPMPNSPPPMPRPPPSKSGDAAGNLGHARLLGIVGFALICCCVVIVAFNWRWGHHRTARASPIMASLPVTSVLASSQKDSKAATSSTSDKKPPGADLAGSRRSSRAKISLEMPERGSELPVKQEKV